MNVPSSLSDSGIPLVIDTSVLVSLHACTYGHQIMSAIPNKIMVPDIVLAEFERGTTDKSFLSSLTSAGIIEIHNLTDDEFELFGEIVSDLDDGESATIAMAISRRFLPVIDERKGRAHARLQAASLVPVWCLDLLRHPSVIRTVGAEMATEALYLALRESHMRIPSESVEEVIELIGYDRARGCTSIPGYKRRFANQAERI